MPIKPVGYSGSLVSVECESCSEKKLEFVQTQKYFLKLGKIGILGSGSREFGLYCSNCGNIQQPGNNQEKKAKKLGYSVVPVDDSATLLRSGKKSKTKKYPVLNSERRQKLIESNRKEGILSMIIGLVIGIIILPLPFQPWSIYIGFGIIVYSILGGFYGIFEDPERKHREYIDHNVDV